MNDGHWWIGVLLPDSTFHHINLHSKGKIKAHIESETHEGHGVSGVASAVTSLKAADSVRTFLKVLQNCAFDRAGVPDDYILVTTGAATALRVGDLRALLGEASPTGEQR